MLSDILKDILNANLQSQIFIIVSILLLSIFNTLIFTIKKFSIRITTFIILHIAFGILIEKLIKYNLQVHIIVYIIPSFIIAIFLSLFVGKTKKKYSDKGDKNYNPFLVKFPANTKVELDLHTGLLIIGAAGSGKTVSGYYPIIKHCAENNISGIIYDYKDFELTEVVNYFYEESKVPLYTVYPHDPDYSYKVNPIHPSYIKDMEDVSSIFEALVDNYMPASSKGENKFFYDAAAGAMAGIAWRLKEEYEEKCNLPYVSAMLLLNEVADIANYIKQSNKATILASEFIDSIGNEKQLSSVKSTISGIVKKIATPNLYTILSGNDFGLDLNNTEKPKMMSIVNHPKRDNVISPIISMINKCAILQMSERDRNPSLLLLDEAATFRFPDIHKIPQTLRSYNIATVLGIQDKAVAKLTYSQDILNATITNLSARIIGKANEPETANYYQKFFEIIKEKTHSINRSTGLLGASEARVNIGEKERTKHRSFEFYKLQKGQFFVFDEEGNDKMVKFKPIKTNPKKPKRIYNYSETEKENNFDSIIRDAKQILENSIIV